MLAIYAESVKVSKYAKIRQDIVGYDIPDLSLYLKRKHSSKVLIKKETKTKYIHAIRSTKH